MFRDSLHASTALLFCTSIAAHGCADADPVAGHALAEMTPVEVGLALAEPACDFEASCDSGEICIGSTSSDGTSSSRCEPVEFDRMDCEEDVSLSLEEVLEECAWGDDEFVILADCIEALPDAHCDPAADDVEREEALPAACELYGELLDSCAVFSGSSVEVAGSAP